MSFRIKNLVNSGQTGSSVSVFEEVTAPGSGPPLHTHHSQLEVFHVIKGRHKFRVGDDEIETSPGDCVFIPAGVPHAFRNIDSEDGLLHFELLPSGSAESFFERLVTDFGGIEDIGAFFQAHGMDLLGPPIE